MKLAIVLSVWFTAVGLWGQNVGKSPANKNVPATDLALIAPLVIVNPPVAYSTSLRTWQGIPAIERASNGRLWAAWYSGGKGEGPDNFLILATSDNDGRSWSKAKLVVTTPRNLGPVLREFDPCLWIDPTGTLRFFWAQSVSNWDGRGGVWEISTSNPGSASPTWSKPKRFVDGIMLNKPIAVSANRWLLPVGTWRNPPVKLAASSIAASGLSREMIAHDHPELKGSKLYETTDNFHSVHFLGQAVVPDTWFDEHMVVERKDKTLWMLVRTTYGMGQASSIDGGKTWVPGEDTKLSHVNSRFFIRRLKSGDLLLVSNMPVSGTSRSRMTARISTDDGRTWNKGLLLDGRDLVSYPDGVEGPDGRIYLIYDRDRNGDGEILMATFTEQDVLAGHLVSRNAKLEQVIDVLQKGTKTEAGHTK
jgi:hypothetical protein